MAQQADRQVTSTAYVHTVGGLVVDETAVRLPPLSIYTDASPGYHVFPLTSLRGHESCQNADSLSPSHQIYQISLYSCIALRKHRGRALKRGKLTKNALPLSMLISDANCHSLLNLSKFIVITRLSYTPACHGCTVLH